MRSEIRALVERVGALARLDLGELGGDLEALDLGEAGDGRALGAKPWPERPWLSVEIRRYVTIFFISVMPPAVSRQRNDASGKTELIAPA